jgi:hypothetical protein
MIYASIIISNCLLLSAFIYGVSSKQLRTVAKWYLLYLGFVLSTELITETLILGFNNQNISFLYPFYISSEFFALSNMFILSLGLSNKWRSITSILSLALFVEAVILWSHNQFFTPGFGKILSHLIIICLSGHLLIKNLKELEIYNPFIIIYAALFLYYAVSLFLFLLMDQLTLSNIVIWIMNNILSSILYGASIYTFYQLKKSH